MFVELMTDIYGSFSERFMKAQLVMEQPQAYTPPAPTGPRRKYNALGILEDVVEGDEAPAAAPAADAGTSDGVLDVAAAEPPKQGAAVKRDPLIVGAGSTRSLSRTAGAGGAAGGGGGSDWSNVGRNDPCPCGSGKKFKKCHGAAA